MQHDRCDDSGAIAFFKYNIPDTGQCGHGDVKTWLDEASIANEVTSRIRSWPLSVYVSPTSEQIIDSSTATNGRRSEQTNNESDRFGSISLGRDRRDKRRLPESNNCCKTSLTI